MTPRLQESERWCTACQRLTAHLMDPQEWRCLRCAHVFNRIQERRGLFHYLWGVATKGPGYNKAAWQHAADILGIDDGV